MTELDIKLKLAKSMFGSDSTKATYTEIGTVTADSSDGYVTVQIGSADYEGETVADATATIPIIGSASTGEQVVVLIQDGSPVAVAPTGWGDGIQTDIEQAEKVATNYIDYDQTDGVVIGNMTGSELGANTQICVESVGGVDKATINLRDGDDVLAKFRPDKIELGNGNGKTTINAYTMELPLPGGSPGTTYTVPAAKISAGNMDIHGTCTSIGHGSSESFSGTRLAHNVVMLDVKSTLDNMIGNECRTTHYSHDGSSSSSGVIERSISSSVSTESTSLPTTTQTAKTELISEYDTGDDEFSTSARVSVTDGTTTNAMTVDMDGIHIDGPLFASIVDYQDITQSQYVESHSPVLILDRVIYDNLVIQAGGLSPASASYGDIAVPGYRPIALLNTFLTNATDNGQNVSWCFAYSTRVYDNSDESNPDTAYARVRYTGTTTAKIKCIGTIMYVRNTQ